MPASVRVDAVFHAACKAMAGMMDPLRSYSHAAIARSHEDVHSTEFGVDAREDDRAQ
ncbi:MAG: hypothetical protein M3O70_06225 [Actinomycetota bacterium]|nr:hypothetical protein [Actinomycetota bacterium]